MRNLVSLIFVAISSSACVSVLPDAAPPAARYLISDVEAASSGAPVEWSLSVEDPNATQALDTTKIAISNAPGRIEYYADGEWSDRAPRLIGAALVRSFENNGRVLAVGNPVSLPSTDYVLQTDVRKLFVRTNENEAVVVSQIFARITNGRSTVYAAKLFTMESPLDQSDASAAAGKLNTDVGRLIGEIVDWTIAEAETVYAK